VTLSNPTVPDDGGDIIGGQYPIPGPPGDPIPGPPSTKRSGTSEPIGSVEPINGEFCFRVCATATAADRSLTPVREIYSRNPTIAVNSLLVCGNAMTSEGAAADLNLKLADLNSVSVAANGVTLSVKAPFSASAPVAVNAPYRPVDPRDPIDPRVPIKPKSRDIKPERIYANSLCVIVSSR
jgi:hypothetical protein